MTEGPLIVRGLPEPEALAAIGEIALRHGQWDHCLKMAVKTFADVTVEEALDANYRLGTRELRERARKHARQRLGEGTALVKLDALLQRAQRATDLRNKYVHALWGYELDKGPVYKPEGEEFQPSPSPDMLKAVALELLEVSRALTDARLDGYLKNAMDARRTKQT